VFVVASVQVDYTFKAAVLHLGASVDSGHYITVIKRDAGWLVCDDATVTSHRSYPMDIADGRSTYMCLYVAAQSEVSPAGQKDTTVDDVVILTDSGKMIVLMPPAYFARDRCNVIRCLDVWQQLFYEYIKLCLLAYNLCRFQ